MGDRHGLTSDLNILDEEIEVVQIDITTVYAICWGLNCGRSGCRSHRKGRGNSWRRNQTTPSRQKTTKEKEKRLMIQPA
jgi:hypothetical protein